MRLRRFEGDLAEARISDVHSLGRNSLKNNFTEG
jgi:hypothetical protein